MTILATPRRSDAVGNGTTAVYSAGYKIKDKDDFRVYLWQVATGKQLAVLAEGTDYSVQGPFNDDNGFTFTIINALLLDGGGNLPSNDKLTTLGNRADDQTTSLKNQKKYFPASLEAIADKLTVLTQQFAEVQNRLLIAEETETAALGTIAGTPKADDFVQRNAANDGFEYAGIPGGGLVTPGTTVIGNLTGWGDIDGDEITDTGIAKANVTLNDDTDVKANGWVLDEDDFISDSDEKLATQQSIKAFVVAQIASNVNLVGDYNAATNTPDLDVSPSGITKGDMYIVSVPGVFFTANVEAGDSLVAEKDNPTLETDWIIIQTNLDAASVKVLYESNANTNAFTDAEQTKLTNIETLADVTDETNVVAALDGATIPTAVPVAADKALFQDNGSSDALSQNTWATLFDELATIADDFPSSGQTITSAALLTLAHGLTRGGSLVDPKDIFAYIECTSADVGYAVGDKVAVDLNNSSDASTSRNTSFRFDDTNIYVKFTNQTEAFVIANKGTSAAGGIVNTKWDLFVRAKA